jgi:hypothetical protein
MSASFLIVHMPRKLCPFCEEMYEAAFEETECCRKPKCVKANQRKKKREAAGITQVKRGRPSKSPTVLLKQRTKERIMNKLQKIGQAEGPSTTPPASGDASDSDVPPIVVSDFKMKVDFNAEAERIRANLKEAGLLEKFENPSPADYMPKLDTFPHGMGDTVRFLPTTDSTSINQQARQVIASLKPSKLDPNSAEAELARLEKSQLKTVKKPAASKGKEES